MRYEAFIDRGGTFTDCILIDRQTSERKVTKVLSSDDAPIVGLRELFAIGANDTIPACDIRMGTTVATNAVLERRGVKTALLITKGFADLLKIGDQTRPQLFELKIEEPRLLCDLVHEFEARLTAQGELLSDASDEELKSFIDLCLREEVKSVALVVLHAYANPQYEQLLQQRILALWPEHQAQPHFSLSTLTSPEQGFLARTGTTVLDAYVRPLLRNYLQHLEKKLPGSRLRLMQSAGGLTSPELFSGPQAILSGPAGGIVAAEKIAETVSSPCLLTLDMGGTSTDVSLIQGRAALTHEMLVDGIRLRTPLLDIHTVAAGGGSVCEYDGYRLTVGPQSVGSDPGPVCYGRAPKEQDASTPLAVTDINLVLGRLCDDLFPIPLAEQPAQLGLEKLAHSISDKDAPSAEKLAYDFSQIVTANMAEALRTVTLQKGVNAQQADLLVFGGAAGQHACSIARYLGIRRVYAHRLSGVLSAYGIGQADILWQAVLDAGRCLLEQEALKTHQSLLDNEAERGWSILRKEQQQDPQLCAHEERKAALRYRGTESSLSVPWAEAAEMRTAFEEEHQRRFGYTREDSEIEMVSLAVHLRLSRAPAAISNKTAPGDSILAASADSPSRDAPPRFASSRQPKAPSEPLPDIVPLRTQRLIDHRGEAIQAPVYRLAQLEEGQHKISGPALLLDTTSTYFVEAGFIAELKGELLELKQEQESDSNLRSASDSARLAILANRFSVIATQMGEALRRSASSTNIRDRLDYSCAIFGPDGSLVANAPHIPVHLGAMSETVKAVLRMHPHMNPGDAYVSNDPALGGSHLPDITVVSPVFDNQGTLLCFTASRGHHADIGGITPGSMPAFSKYLSEEGIVLSASLLVQNGKLLESSLREQLAQGPYPARNPDENLADLRAQLAANQLGARLALRFADELSSSQLIEGMQQVRALSAQWMRDTIAALPDGTRRFSDKLDSGAEIHVKISIDGDKMCIDFSGTSPQSDDNLNAPRAVTLACVLYVLRTLIARPLPLNEGCLEPIELIIPEASLLNPEPGRAVAAGNVETSQRVVDVLLAALDLAAASQGSMNNLSFGNEHFGYYETISGGAGAGPGFFGASGVHTHMTNTRITDPEILEERFPVRLKEFSLRTDSAGRGEFSGGQGVVRRLQALETLHFSILSNRRNCQPFGLSGGHGGAVGENLLNGALLASSYAGTVNAGDEICIKTPGGGGYGQPAR